MKYIIVFCLLATPAFAQYDNYDSHNSYNDNSYDEGAARNQQMQEDAREQQYQQQIEDQQRELQQYNAQTPAERFTNTFGDCYTCR